MLYRYEKHRNKDKDHVRIQSYDGKVKRVYSLQNDFGHGSIEHFNERSNYFEIYDPLAMQMLIDSESDIGMAFRALDLVHFLDAPDTIVFEKLVDVSGVDCIQITDGLTMAYLDPAKNFSVVRVDGLKTDLGSLGDGASIARTSTREFTDYEEVENGLWAPEKILSYKLVGSQKNLQTEISISQQAYNSDIPLSKFQDIFPDGTPVKDRITDIN